MYERYVNFASYCTAKNVLSSNLQTCNFVVDPEHHILAWLVKVMHDDRKCILSVLICKPVILVKIKKKRSSALVAEKNEIADQMVQLHRLICCFVVLIQLLMGFWRIMLHPN